MGMGRRTLRSGGLRRELVCPEFFAGYRRLSPFSSGEPVLRMTCPFPEIMMRMERRISRSSGLAMGIGISSIPPLAL